MSKIPSPKKAAKKAAKKVAKKAAKAPAENPSLVLAQARVKAKREAHAAIKAEKDPHKRNLMRREFAQSLKG